MLSRSLFLVCIYAIAVVCQSDNFFNATIGPYGICGSAHLNIESVFSDCYSRCVKPPQPNGGYTLIIHQADVQNTGPTTVECRKVTMEQIFTKSWLFSTSKTEPRITSESVSENECMEVIRKNCPSYDCNIREPHNLGEKYYYASDTILKKTFVTAISMPSSLTTDGNKIMILPLGSETSFDIREERGISGNGMYVWKEQTYTDLCPFKPAAKYGCDFYSNVDTDKHFVCAKGGFYISFGWDLETAYPKCKGLVLSREGIIYEAKKGDNARLHSQRIDMTDTHYKHEDTESFRDKMNHVLANFDSDMCMLQCEVLSLEARARRNTFKLLKVGSSLILLEPNGTGIGCKSAYGCKLSKPRVFCGSPPRIGIECTGQSGYWDPTSPYLTSGDFCARPKSDEVLKITAGHHLYNVDADLTILVPSGLLHGRTADVFSRDHMDRLQFSKKDMSELRAHWSASKSTSGVEAYESSSSSKITAPILGYNILQLPGTLAHYLSQKTHEIAVFLVVLCFVLISIWVGVKIVVMSTLVKHISQVSLRDKQENKRDHRPVVRWI